MMAWDPEKAVWHEGHAVLTRSGFLHWIRGSVTLDAGGQASDQEHRDMFCLARCVARPTTLTVYYAMPVSQDSG